MPAALMAEPEKITATVSTGSANAPGKSDAGGAFHTILHTVRMADRDVGAQGALAPHAVPLATRPPETPPPDTRASSAIPNPEGPVPPGAVVASKTSGPGKDVHHAAIPEDVSAQAGTPTDILPAQLVPPTAVAAAPIGDRSAGPATTTAEARDTDPETSRVGDTRNGEALGRGASKPPDSTVTIPVPDQAPAVATKPETVASDRKRLMGSAETTAAPPAGSADDQGSADVTAFPILLSPSPAPAPISSTPPEAPTGAATPAAQLAPALLTLAKTPDGTQQMTLRLHPHDLGMVQVRIVRGLSGLTRVDISAEKAATLDALRGDQPQLHRALDEAGVSSTGRSITFHAAHPADPASGATSHGHPGDSRPPSGRTGSFDTNGSSSGAKGDPPSQGTNAPFTGRRWHSPPASAGSGPGSGPGPIPTSYRVGLDIIA